MSRHDPLVRLKHMRDAALEAIEMAEGRVRADLDRSKILERALRCQVIMIGEAAASLPTETRDRTSEIPWRDIIGMRNIVVHGYDLVDLDELWHAVTVNVPELIQALDRLIAGIEAEREDLSERDQ